MKKTMNFIVTATLALSLLQACDKQSGIISLPPPPVGDASNNVCVFYQYHGSNDSNPNCTKYSVITDQKASQLLSAMVRPLVSGVGGVGHRVFDSNYQLYNNNRCTRYDPATGGWRYGESGYFAAITWAKYDCRGIAIDTRVYGPYPNTNLEALKDQNVTSIRSEGYEIAYFYYEPVTPNNPNNTSSYIVIYAYRPDTLNRAQRVAVEALQSARSLNQIAFGNPSRPLSDTLSVLSRAYPAVSQHEDFSAANSLIQSTNEILRRTERVYFGDQR